jgi:hypothetical protein
MIGQPRSLGGPCPLGGGEHRDTVRGIVFVPSRFKGDEDEEAVQSAGAET